VAEEDEVESVAGTSGPQAVPAAHRESPVWALRVPSSALSSCERRRRKAAVRSCGTSEMRGQIPCPPPKPRMSRHSFLITTTANHIQFMRFLGHLPRSLRDALNYSLCHSNLLFFVLPISCFPFDMSMLLGAHMQRVCRGLKDNHTRSTCNIMLLSR
jgi:hypothetical protein